MIDTLNLWIDRADAPDPFSVVGFLADVEEAHSDKWGYRCKGSLGDYRVSAGQSGISLQGSLSKFYLPSNLYTLTRDTAEEALEKMSDLLHLDLFSTARVTRVDISTILPTSRPPADYYRFMGNKPYFKRLQAHPDTLYYQTAQERLCFYDKAREARAKGAEIPPGLEGRHLLRYELRYMTRIGQQLNRGAPFYAGNLVAPDTYSDLVNRWRNEYGTIKKLRDMNTATNTLPTTPREAKEELFKRLLAEEGLEAIDAFISDLKAKKAFGDPKYYSRLKADLTKTLQGRGKAEESELMKELEGMVEEAAENQIC